MLDERFRLMYLSKDRTDIKQISLTWKKFVALSTVAGITLIGILIGGVVFVNRLHQDYRLISLKNDKEFLQQQLLSMKEKVADLSTEFATVEKEGDRLRNVAGIPNIDDDTRKFGVGGSAYTGSPDIGYYSEDIKKTAGEINADLDRFLRAVQYEKHSLLSVAAKVSEQQDEVDHYPSIWPVLGGHVDSKFGWRTDPFTKRPKTHFGIDIYAPLGTKAMASANGRVSKVDVGVDYGNWVEVDHGYGFKTRYCHLSKVLVKKGQKVTRWDCLGEVGKTGRAVGYHLHYEVLMNDRRVNPENYLVENN